MAGFPQPDRPYLAVNYEEFYIDGTPPCCDSEGTLDLEWSTAMANSFGAAANTAAVYMYEGAEFQSFDVYRCIQPGLKRRSCAGPQHRLGRRRIRWHSAIGDGHRSWHLQRHDRPRLDPGSGLGRLWRHRGLPESRRGPLSRSDPDMVSAGGSAIQFLSGGVFQLKTPGARRGRL